MVDYFSLFLVFQCGVLVKRYYQEYKEAYPDESPLEGNQTSPNFTEKKDTDKGHSNTKEEKK